MLRGTTLPELLVGLAILAILLAIGAPKIAPWIDRSAVEGEARGIVAAQRRARLEAVARGVVVALEIHSDTLWLEDGQGARLWQTVGPANRGVTLSPAGHRITYAPSGMALGFSNATLQLQRGAAHRQVVISRLGRVRILP